jgi:hypothetical protein
MTTPRYFIYRIDRLDANGEILERVAGIQNRELATAAYETACRFWPISEPTKEEAPQLQPS